MAYIIYNVDSISTGVSRNLKDIPVEVLSTGDRAHLKNGNEFSVFVFNSVSVDDEDLVNFPRKIRPADFSSSGVWEEIIPSKNYIDEIKDSLSSDISSKEDSFTKNSAFNKNFGSTTDTVCEGNDSRLSDSRTPTTHSHTVTDLPMATETQAQSGTANDVIMTPLRAAQAIASLSPDIRSVEIKTASYSIATADANKLIKLGSATVGEKLFTLPSVDAAQDGMVLFVANEARYNLTVRPSDLDHVWNSGACYGVELPDPGTMIGLRYCHAQTQWDIVYKVGGRVMIEGLKLLEPMEAFSRADQDTLTLTRKVDLSKKHTISLFNNVKFNTEEDSKFAPGCWTFSGTDEYASYKDSPDWDIFGNQTGHKTVAFWMFSTNSGVTEFFVSQWETNNDRWHIYKTSSGTLYFYLLLNSVVQFNVGALMGHNAWHHIALILDDNKVGGYYDGIQIAYTETWNTNTFSGQLVLGQNGGNAFYFKGNMQDLMIAYNNPFNANPSAALTDSFTVPNGLFQGVM